MFSLFYYYYYFMYIVRPLWGFVVLTWLESLLACGSLYCWLHKNIKVSVCYMISGVRHHCLGISSHMLLYWDVQYHCPSFLLAACLTGAPAVSLFDIHPNHLHGAVSATRCKSFSLHNSIRWHSLCALGSFLSLQAASLFIPQLSL